MIKFVCPADKVCRSVYPTTRVILIFALERKGIQHKHQTPYLVYFPKVIYEMPLMRCPAKLYAFCMQNLICKHSLFRNFCCAAITLVMVFYLHCTSYFNLIDMLSCNYVTGST